MEKVELIRRAKIIAEEMDGVFSPHLPFYTLSLAYPIRRGMVAFRKYEISKTTNEAPDDIFSFAQEGINYAASVSRFLWPSNSSRIGKEGVKLHKKRGEFLRKKLNILDSSPLNDRELRNAFEHFDERLDLYLLEELAGEFFPQAQLGNHIWADDPISKIFKLIDTNSDCIVLFNEKFFFEPVIQALQELEKHFS